MYAIYLHMYILRISIFCYFTCIYRGDTCRDEKVILRWLDRETVALFYETKAINTKLIDLHWLRVLTYGEALFH